MNEKENKNEDIIMNEGEGVVTLVDEDGQEHDFEMIAKIEVEDMEYAALLPVEDEDGVYLLKMLYDEDDNLVLVNIEDQDELSDVAAAYEAIADEII